ncbi:carboxymuconolactone decarboxylase family protein [Haliscomenobacter sp.]|uniref:carboxymuconolactone decarboxylase family protein n=1 Tax=Haliscomenobacter sp. TaxID=2717303 RepID=UPI003593FC92
MENSYQIALQPKKLQDANEEVKAIFESTKASLGMVPNMYGNMGNSTGLLATYKFGYDHFRKNSGFSKAEQEVIFLTISYENGCEYCMAAHSMLADMISKVPVEVTNAIRDGKIIPDPKLKALSDFTSIMVNKRGHPSETDVRIFLEAGYSENHILEIILAIAVKTISNYSNHLFQTPLDAPFKMREWAVFKVARKAVQFFSRT